MTNELTKIDDKHITATDSGNLYLFYGAAKQAGIQPGDTFATDLGVFRILPGYVNWIPERNCKYSGYRVEEIQD